MLDLNHDITHLRGAEYNPRRIDEPALATLRESIRSLGLVKPLIARGDLLVAGHQRTKALRSMGVTTAPVYLLPRHTTTYDEIRFNQLHNGTDLDSGDENCHLTFPSPPAIGYTSVQPADIHGNMRAKLATVRKEIADLITKYGPWGGCVATESGKVIHAAQYALAAKLTRTPLTVYVVPDAREAEYRAFLSKQYGVFSYDHLERHTYVQSFAQMMRLRDGPSGKAQKSTLYEQFVIPWLSGNRAERAIDFGSGQGDYARHLRARGFNIHDVELFRRKGGAKVADLAAINRMIDGMVYRMKTHGPFDSVVCDSVLNSVDSLEAEASVMAVLNFLCRLGGKVFFSGRRLERLEHQDRHTMSTGTQRYVEFPDEHGFTALYREGNWFYQKFHSKEDVVRLAERFGLKIIRHARNLQTTSWQVEAEKVRELDRDAVRRAIEFEFNLPVGRDTRINRHADVLALLE